jgi:hypothetical protein
VQTYVALAGGTGAVDPATALRAQQATLDLQPWLLPHLGLALVGLAGAGVAAVRFRRFRGLI